MSLIPHYDPADGELLNFVSDATAQRYVAEGIAHAVRTKNGRIARLYRRVRERAYGTARDGIAGLHAAANQTTRRSRLDGGALVREHRHADGWGWNEACYEVCLALCNEHQDKHPGDCICKKISTDVIDEIIRLRYAPWLRYVREVPDGNPRTFAGAHRWQFSPGMISAVAEHGPVAPAPPTLGRCVEDYAALESYRKAAEAKKTRPAELAESFE